MERMEIMEGMEFSALLDRVVDLLRLRGRVSYRALKIQFNLDDNAIEALKDEIVYAQQLGVDEDDRVLVWTGEGVAVPPAPDAPDAERRQLTVMSLSRLWQQQGNQAEAHQLLAKIYGWFAEGFDTADLQEAKALLDELA